MDSAWQGNWKQRLLDHLHARGVASLTDFLRQKPAIPYLEIADILGQEDVTAFQVEWLHFEEAIKQGKFREAAIDSLVREISHHLPNGWKVEAIGDFNTAGVWADWIVRLENYASNIRPIASALWRELLASRPPAGWKPEGPDDRRVVQVFDRNWPSTTHVELKTADDMRS